MDKDDYLGELYDEIKNEITTDTDVIALLKILENLMISDLDESVVKWKYIINKYDLKSLSRDIDFEPIMNDYAVLIIKKMGLKYFFEIMGDLKVEKRKEIYKVVFNAYNKNSKFSEILKNLIRRKKQKEVRQIIDLIVVHQTEFPIDVFDLNFFLKNVILWHLEFKIMDIDFLKEISDIPQKAKDRAVLKTFLIDYI